jgi:replicative DNA helicase
MASPDASWANRAQRVRPGGELRDSVPPHNDEAEKAVLGAILLNTDPETVTEVFNILKEEDFYKGSNRIIYGAIRRLSDRHDSIDFITLKDELKSLGELDKIDPAYLASLTTGVPSSANVVYYAKIVKETSVRRFLIRTAAKISSDAYDDTIDLRIVIDDAEKNVLDISTGQNTSDFVHAKDLVNQTFDSIERIVNNQGKYTGIASGFEELDALLSGFQKSELIIIGARPSVGKTALALCMAANISGISGENTETHPVGFFSLEMSRMAIMMRLLCSEALIGSKSIQKGLLQDSDWGNLVTAADRIYGAPLYLSDMPAMKLLDLRAAARRMHKQKKVDIIFIDYMGQIQAERKDIPRWEQYSEISMSLKALARELDIPIVVLSQLGRQVEHQKGVPTMADLRESGSIEQDADVIVLVDKVRKIKAPVERRFLSVVKQRNGPVGDFQLAFRSLFTRFDNLTEALEDQIKRYEKEADDKS